MTYLDISRYIRPLYEYIYAITNTIVECFPFLNSLVDIVGGNLCVMQIVIYMHVTAW